MPVAKAAYNIVSVIKMSDPKVQLIRVTPTDLTITLREIFSSLSDLCWITKMPNVNRVFRMSMQQRAEKTIVKLKEELSLNPDSTISSNAGEYVVSELAHSIVVNELNYTDIPLGELFKEKVSGNPGFDFFAENPHAVIVLFGEAKYKSKANAYDSAFEQIDRFATEGKDIIDMADIEHFCSEESQENMAKGKKGYMAAFSATSMSDKILKSHIEQDDHFKSLLKYDELLCVAVNFS